MITENSVNLGCGEDIRPGYCNVDVRAITDVDVIADLRDLPFEAGAFSEALAQDVLEHFWKPTSVLTEWRRVLKPGGELYVRVPDWNVLGDPDYWEEIPWENLEKHILGGHANDYDIHHRLYTADVLQERLIEAGFEDIVTKEHRETPLHWHVSGYGKA